MGQSYSAGNPSDGKKSITIMVHFGHFYQTDGSCQLQFGRNVATSPPSQDEYGKLTVMLRQFLVKIKDGQIKDPMMAVVAGKMIDGNFVEISRHDHLILYPSEMMRRFRTQQGYAKVDMNQLARHRFYLQWKLPLHPISRRRIAEMIFNIGALYGVGIDFAPDPLNVTGFVLSEHIRVHDELNQPPVSEGSDRNGIWVTGGNVEHGDARYPEAVFNYPTTRTAYYDDDDEEFVPGPRLTVGRSNHISARMPNGDIIVAGGITERGGVAELGIEGFEESGHQDENVTSEVIRSCERLVAGGTKFEKMPFDLMAPRVDAACAVTSYGTLVVCGGKAETGRNSTTCQNTVEVMDNDTKHFNLLSMTMRTGRCRHTATAISNKEILVCGGITSSGHSTTFTEILNLETGQTRPSVAMRLPRASHSATLLSDGTIFICGEGSAEIMDLSKGTSTALSIPERLPQSPIAARLRSGDVMFFESADTVVLSQSHLYKEDSKKIRPAASLDRNRDHFAMTSY